MAVMGIEEIGELCDVIAASLEIDTKEKQEILSEFDSYDRAEKLIIFMMLLDRMPIIRTLGTIRLRYALKTLTVWCMSRSSNL